jgi:hypothetical protein
MRGVFRRAGVWIVCWSSELSGSIQSFQRERFGKKNLFKIVMKDRW